MMRVLQIKSTSEARLRLGFLETLCAMAYPLDRTRGGLLLKEFLKSGTDGLAEPDADCPEVVRLDRFLWKGLGEPGRSSVRDGAASQFDKGRVAGRVLLFALRCGVHRPEHRSVSKAIFLVAELAKGARARYELPMSESKVLSYWRDFLSVAHLYASLLLVEDMKEDWLSEEEFEEQSSQFALFLAIAGRVSRAAHQQIPPIGRTSKAAASDGRRLVNSNLTVQIMVDGISLDLDDNVQLAYFLADITRKEVSILGKYHGGS
jgi:hypothetical protein